MARFISIDFIRGLAIWAVVVIHSFGQLFAGTNQLLGINLDNISIFLLIPLVPVLYASSLAGVFLLVSLVANTLGMQKRAEKGAKLSSIVKKNVVSGSALLLVGYFTEIVINLYGLLGRILEQNADNWYDGFFYGLYLFETLQTIGASIIINALLFGILYRNGGHKKIQRNMYILLLLALAVLILTPVINTIIRVLWYPWWGTTGAQVEQFMGVPASPFALLFNLLLIPLAGVAQPLFPFLCTSFIGSIIGIAISQPKPSRNFARYGYIAAFSALILSILVSSFNGLVNFNFLSNIRRETSWYLFTLFGQILIIVFLISIIEFRGKPKRSLKITLYHRRWSVIALSIYSLQILFFLARFPLQLITGQPFAEFQKLNLILALVALPAIILVWEIIIFAWSKVNFIYSFEWFLVQLGQRSSGISSDKLNFRKVVYDVEPYYFLETTPGSMKIPIVIASILYIIVAGILVTFRLTNIY